MDISVEFENGYLKQINEMHPSFLPLQYPLILMNQKHLRCEIYKGLNAAILRGEKDPATQGKMVILLSSFTGGARYKI